MAQEQQPIPIAGRTDRRLAPRYKSIPTAPLPIPISDRFLLFSPHPDDVAISAGALAAWAARAAVPTVVALVTDGSEARLPCGFMAQHGWTPAMSPSDQQRLRGEIRVAEALEEIRRLGLGPLALRRLRQQRWFQRHETGEEFLNPDGSLRDVSRFRAGVIDDAAVAEIRELIAKTPQDYVLCGVPDPRDRLLMHRIVAALVARAVSTLRLGRTRHYGLLFCECLSTEPQPEAQQQAFQPEGCRWTHFGFGEELMSVKCHAILAHRSMQERRKQFGGYTNPGTEFYDSIVRRSNGETARRNKIGEPFAERYGWLDRPSPAALEEVCRVAAVPLP